MKRHFLAFLLACAAFAACADATNAIPWRVEKYSLIARQMALREAFDTFGASVGMIHLKRGVQRIKMPKCGYLRICK